ncbi:MAG: hypothetical protein Q7T18_11640, partial [Sedimentisphaerales bacterium]|nr:hypothetical protein [Sedimentisphaerales bacterium]
MRFTVHLINILLLTAVLLISGCSILNPTPAPPPEPPPAQTKSEKFIAPDVEAPTAIESAIIWSEKYAK